MRIVLAVVAAFLFMSIFVFVLSIAPWYLLGIDHVLESGRFDTAVWVDIYSIVVAFVGALLGGIIARKVGGSATAVFALAVIGFAGGVVNAVGQRSKPEPGPRDGGSTVMQAVTARKEPIWLALSIPVLGVIGVLVGGQRAAESVPIAN
jgi:hypothetical protein